MVSAGTKRRRRARANAIASEAVERHRQAEVEKKVLGIEITSETPASSIFVEDRKGECMEVIKERDRAAVREEMRNAKRARRKTPKTRKSEASAMPINATGMRNNRAKKREIGWVEKTILEKRQFDKPEGHIGNRSSAIRSSKKVVVGRENLWTSDISGKVNSEIGLNRKRLVEKMNTDRKEAVSVLNPGNGLSINPAYEDHQDRLGEALAKVIDEEDDKGWVDQKMSFDPALLTEEIGKECQVTGMKVDDSNDEMSAEEGPEATPAFRGAPERKSRSQRNKEARKRILSSSIRKKANERKLAGDFSNLESISRDAEVEADKLNGTMKKRLLDENPMPKPTPDQPVLKRIAGQNVRTETEVDPFLLRSELGKGIREVRVPANTPLLRDRFMSLQRRGIVTDKKVIKKEQWRMEQARRAEERRDTRKRKGRGSRSNLTFWQNGKRVIL